MTYDGFMRPQTSTTTAGGSEADVFRQHGDGDDQRAMAEANPGRLREGGEAGGGGRGGTKSVVDTVYDACACSPLGKVKQVSQPHAPGATVYTSTFTYDGMGRTLTQVAADGSTTTYEYKGNTVKTTDPALKWKRVTTDEFGNTAQVNEPDPVTTGQEYSTTYQYDLLNHLVQASLPRPTAGGTFTQLRTWTYDSQRRGCPHRRCLK